MELVLENGEHLPLTIEHPAARVIRPTYRQEPFRRDLVWVYDARQRSMRPKRPTIWDEEYELAPESTPEHFVYRYARTVPIVDTGDPWPTTKKAS